MKYVKCIDNSEGIKLDLDKIYTVIDKGWASGEGEFLLLKETGHNHWARRFKDYIREININIKVL
jgi:hypothetical protein